MNKSCKSKQFFAVGEKETQKIFTETHLILELNFPLRYIAVFKNFNYKLQTQNSKLKFNAEAQGHKKGVLAFFAGVFHA